MQLSLPVSTFPAPTTPNAGINGSNPVSGDPSSKSPTDPAENSFESLLPGDAPADKPIPKADNADADQAAAILAVSFWLPVATPTVPPSVPELPSTATPGFTGLSAGIVDGGVIDTAISGPGLSLSCSRSFGPGHTASPAAASAVSFLESSAAKALDGSSLDPVGAKPAVPVTSPAPLDCSNPPESSAPATALSDFPLTAPPTSPLAVATGVVPARSAPSDLVATTTLPIDVVAAQVPAVFPPVTPIQNSKRTAASTATALDGGLARSTGATTEIAPSTSAPDLGGPVAFDPTLNAGKEAMPRPGAPFQEKFAALEPAQPEFAKSNFGTREKYFLDGAQKVVTTAAAGLGISVAQRNATMAAATPARSKFASLVEPATSFVFSGETAPTGTITSEAPAPVATVRETMAAVISAVDALERKADVQQKSVDLQFHVGSEKLGLRVELRDGAVHTTFHTESTEMNGALAREWHRVVQPAMAREIRLAEPVFNTTTPASGSSAFGSLGQGTPHQREPKAPATFSSALRREYINPAAAESDPVAAPAANSSQLLNVLA